MNISINDSKFFEVGGLYQYNAFGFCAHPTPRSGNDLFICIALLDELSVWSDDTKARLVNMRTGRIHEARMHINFQRII